MIRLFISAALVLTPAFAYGQDDTAAPPPEPAPATAPAPDSPSPAPAPAPAAAVSAPASPWTDKLHIGGGAILWYYQPFADGAENNFDLFFANLVLDGKLDKIGLHIEPRFRASKLRPFFDGPAWVEEAYAYGALGPVNVKVGKVYSRLGLFWDDSFYGSIQVYDGLKLAPDYGISAEGTVATADARVGLAYWAQYFVVDGQTNVSLVGRDTISIAGARRRNETVARVEPFFELGDDGVVKVGLSGQYLQADIPGADKEDVFRAAGDVTVKVGKAGVWGEYLHQSGKHVAEFPVAPAGAEPGRASGDNHYVLVGGSYTWRDLTARYNFSYASYADVEVSETLHEPAIGYAVSENLGLLAELVLWRRSAPIGDSDVDKSLNVTLNGHF